MTKRAKKPTKTKTPLKLNGVLTRQHLLAAVAYERGVARQVGVRMGLSSPCNVSLYANGSRKNQPIPEAWYLPFRRAYGFLFGVADRPEMTVKHVPLHAPEFPQTAREHALRALKDKMDRRQREARARRQRRESDAQVVLLGTEIRRKPVKDGTLAPGTFMYVSIAKDDYIACLTLDQVQRIRLVEAFDPDEEGGQRPARTGKVRAISRVYSEQPWARFPEPLLGETPDGTIISIDGNNRTQGWLDAAVQDQELASRGFLVRVIVADATVCKQLFNLHGTTPTRIPSEVCLANGDGGEACATHIMNAARKYGAKAQQALTVFHGVVCGNGSPSGTGYFSFMPGATPLPEWAPETADIVLDVWSDNEQWEGVRWGSFKRDRNGSGYSGTGTMRVIGALARDYMSREQKEPDRLRAALKVLGDSKLWTTDGTMHVLYESSLGIVDRNLRVARGIVTAAGLAPKQGWPRRSKTEGGAYSTKEIKKAVADRKRALAKAVAE